MLMTFHLWSAHFFEAQWSGAIMTVTLLKLECNIFWSISSIHWQIKKLKTSFQCFLPQRTRNRKITNQPPSDWPTKRNTPLRANTRSAFSFDLEALNLKLHPAMKLTGESLLSCYVSIDLPHRASLSIQNTNALLKYSQSFTTYATPPPRNMALQKMFHSNLCPTFLQITLLGPLISQSGCKSVGTVHNGHAMLSGTMYVYQTWKLIHLEWSESYTIYF